MEKLGRNDPCHCGSGKKYKKCCLEKDAAARPLPAPPRAFNDDELREAARLDGQSLHDNDNAEPVVRSFAHATGRAAPAPVEDPEVKAWWGGYEAIQARGDTHEALRELHRVMDEQPQLVERLHLDEEAIFNLHSRLAETGELQLYVKLLLRLRQEFPAAYAPAQGLFDRALIAEALRAGEYSAVATYLEAFKEHPDAFPDELSSVVDMLLATNSQTELLDLARSVGKAVHDSPRVIGGEFILDWLILDAYLPAYDARDASADAVRGIISGLEALKIGLEPQRALIAKELAEIFGPFPAPADFKRSKKEGPHSYHASVMHHFTGYLHDHVGLSWSSARAFASELTAYLQYAVPKEGATHPFQVDAKHLEAYLAEHFLHMLSMNGIRGLILLQALWWLSDYLEINGQEAAITAPLKPLSEELATKMRAALGATDPGSQLLGNPAQYRWASAGIRRAS